jgi:hypothetical protein
VNTEWDKVMVMPLLADLGAAQDSTYCQLLCSFEADVGGWQETVLTDSEQNKLNNFWNIHLSTAAEMDRYRFVPASFPWRFAMLLASDETVVQQTACEAKQIWEAVLQFEKKYPDKLRRLCPVTSFHCFREVMIVGACFC